MAVNYEKDACESQKSINADKLKFARAPTPNCECVSGRFVSSEQKTVSWWICQFIYTQS